MYQNAGRNNIGITITPVSLLMKPYTNVQDTIMKYEGYYNVFNKCANRKKDGVLMKLFDDRAGWQKQMGC